MSTVYGARDQIVGTAGTRTVNMRLPGYFTEIRIGSGHTSHGAAFEITTPGAPYFQAACEFDAGYAGTLRADNSLFGGTAASPIIGITRTGPPALEGFVIGYSNANADGCWGYNEVNGAAGRVGCGNGYDFYASGSGTNYGPFTGTHDALMLKMEARRADIGDIVVDVRCLARSGISGTLFQVELAGRVPGRAALGVICSIKQWDEDDVISAFHEGFTREESFELDQDLVLRKKDRLVRKTNKKFAELRDTGLFKLLAVNALGEGQINVCGLNGDIKQDDLIVISQMPGKGQRQNDDMVYNYTVARAREGVTFDNPTDTARIACIYLSG